MFPQDDNKEQQGRGRAVRAPAQLGVPAPTAPLANQGAQLAAHRARQLAIVDYYGAFVMMDLTHTEAHARRQLAITTLLAAHAAAEAKLPGSGFMVAGDKVDSDESHISVVRGIDAPVLNPNDVLAGHEKPAPGHHAAFAALASHSMPALELEDKITYWPGPAGGPYRYMAAVVVIADPSGTLSRMQESWAAAGGTFKTPTQPMHLTLAYLKLGVNELPQQVAESVLLRLAGRDGRPVKWTQDEVYYSGRYGKEFARTKLPGA